MNKENNDLIKYEMSITKKIKKLFIEKIFTRSAFSFKFIFVQRIAIKDIMRNFDFELFLNVWPKISQKIKEKYYYELYEKIYIYLKNNISNIKDRYILLPDEFKNGKIMETNEKIENNDVKLKNTFIEKFKVQDNLKGNILEEKEDLFKALTEVKYIFSTYDETVLNKIPKKFLDFINDNYDREYVPNFNIFKNINNQKLLRKTRVLLAIIYEKYIKV